jgi:hypothetical protein
MSVPAYLVVVSVPEKKVITFITGDNVIKLILTLTL